MDANKYCTRTRVRVHVLQSAHMTHTLERVGAETVAVAATDERRELRVPRATQSANQVVKQAQRHGRRAVPEHSLLLPRKCNAHISGTLLFSPYISTLH